MHYQDDRPLISVMKTITIIAGVIGVINSFIAAYQVGQAFGFMNWHTGSHQTHWGFFFLTLIGMLFANFIITAILWILFGMAYNLSYIASQQAATSGVGSKFVNTSQAASATAAKSNYKPQATTTTQSSEHLIVGAWEASVAIFEFMADGRMTRFINGKTEYGTWSIDDGKLSIDGLPSHKGTWNMELSQTRLTIERNGGMPLILFRVNG